MTLKRKLRQRRKLMSNFNLDDIMLFLDDIGACKNNNLDLEKAEAFTLDKFDCSLEVFAEIASFLVDYTFVLNSPLTGEGYQGFVHNNSFVLKRGVPDGK